MAVQRGEPSGSSGSPARLAREGFGPAGEEAGNPHRPAWAVTQVPQPKIVTAYCECPRFACLRRHSGLNFYSPTLVQGVEAWCVLQATSLR